MKKTRYFFVALMLMFTACAPSGEGLGVADSQEQVDPLKPENPPTEKPNEYNSLPWEANHHQAEAWTNYLYTLLETQGARFIEGTSDVTTFCPRYFQLERSEKMEFWGNLFSEMSYYESRHQPTRRFAEPKKKDKITGKQLYSEGLMQMSYQDVMAMPQCQFDWKRDSKLKPEDPRKSVLDPYKNLHCAFLILRKQITRHDKIAIGTGAYWAVIKSSYERNKLPQIRAALKSLEFCQ